MTSRYTVASALSLKGRKSMRANAPQVTGSIWKGKQAGGSGILLGQCPHRLMIRLATKGIIQRHEQKNVAVN